MAGTRSLGRLVVQLAAEIAQYRQDWDQAVNTTQDGAARVERATKGMDSASGALRETLVRQAGAFGTTAGAAAEYAGAAAAATGAVTGLTVAGGALVAALGAVAVAAYQGNEEQKALNNTLLLTGNYAGMVAGQLDQMAIRTAASIGGTVGAAREVLGGLVATGRFTVESLGEVAAAVQLVARFSGQTNEQVLKDFAGMADGVAKWAAKHNEAYHFLDLATYRYIQQLEEQGRQQEAMRVASEALSRHLGGDLTQNLGILEQGWHKVKVAASAAWDAMKDLGREDSLQERLDGASRSVEAARRRYDQARAGGAAMLGGGTAFELSNSPRQELQEALQQQGVLQSDLVQERRLAAARGEQAQATQKAIEADEKWGKLLERNRTRTQQMNDELRQAREVAQAAGASKEALARIEEQIRARYTTKGKSEGEKEAERQRRALAELSGVQVDYMQQLSDLNTLRQRGNVSEERYIELVNELIAKQPMAKKLIEEHAKEVEREEKATSDAAKARSDYLVNLDKSTAKIEQEIQKEQEHAQSLGMTKIAVAALVAAKLEDQAVSLELQAIRAMDKNLDQAAYDALMREAQAYRNLAKAKKDSAVAETAHDAQKELNRDIEQMDDLARRVFADMAANGEDAFKTIGRAAKAHLIDMLYQVTARPIMVQVMTSLAGGGGQATVGGAVGGLGGGLNLLGALGGLGGMFGAGGLSGALAAGAGWMTGATTLSGALGAAGSLVGTGTAGGVMSGLAMGAGALGPLALGAMALYSFLSSKKGGPKQEGYYNPYSNAAWSTRNDGDVAAASQAFAQGLQGQYDSIVRSYGTRGGLQFGAGFITDPKGDAPSMATIGAGKGGKELINLYRDDIGRSEQELQAAMTEMGGRALLQALQLEEVGGKLGEYLTKLGDVSTLTADQVKESVAKIEKAGAERAALEEQIFQLTATEEEKVRRAREQELEAIDDTNEALLRRVYQLQDEKKAAETLEQALANAASSSRAYLDFIQSSNSNIRQFIDGLNAGPQGMLSSQQQLANARDQFGDQIRLAKAGDRTARQGILQYAQQLIDAQTAHTASGPQTRATIEWVQKMLESLPDMESAEEYLGRIIEEQGEKTNSVLRGLRDKIWQGLWGTAGLLATKFDELDTTADGLLNFAELRVALGPMASDRTIRRLIDQADTNNDGLLSQQEILNASVIEVGKAVRETSEQEIKRNETAVQTQTSTWAEWLEYITTGKSKDGKPPKWDGTGGPWQGEQPTVPTTPATPSQPWLGAPVAAYMAAPTARGGVRSSAPAAAGGDASARELVRVRKDLQALTNVMATGLGRTARAAEETAAALRSDTAAAVLRTVRGGR